MKRGVNVYCINTLTGCHEWAAGRSQAGYGVKSINNKQHFVHRVKWEETHGPIPDGMCVLHRCDNPPRCNVEHLFLGTKGDNARDMVSNGRDNASARPHVIVRGERSGMAKLTEAAVRYIRQEVERGPYGTMSRLAREFGVSRNTIRSLCLRRHWKHVS